MKALYIIAIVFIVLIAFCFYLIVIANTGSDENLIDCAPGQCITNLFTGIKNCPSDTSEILSINPTNEVCNSPFTCEDEKTPFAEQSDGSTNSDGVCPEGVKCRCLQKAACANYITSYFSPFYGNAFQPIRDQRIVFEQISSYKDLAGVFQQEPPLSTGSLDFCSVPFEWVNELRIWPSECTRGTLAFLPEDPSNFGPDNFQTTPLGCVIGEKCPEGTFAFWDNRVNSVMCLELPL